MSDTDNIQRLCAEAIQANAAKQFTTKCLVCGKSHTQSLHWLQTHKFKCPDCGGKLDDKPLHQITLSVLKKLQSSSKPSPIKARNAEPPAVASRPAGIKNYQLVLQFQGGALDDFDVLIALEDELGEALGDLADVDGHDIGAGEANIFIFTSDPVGAFNVVRPVLIKSKCLEKVTAAYREVEGEDYTVIWPVGCKMKFEVA